MTEKNHQSCMTRRNFLLTSLQTAAGLTLLSPFDALSKKIPNNTISFYHTHTGEEFDLFLTNHSCPPAARKKLFSFLRDFRTGDVHPIDLRLFDILLNIKRETGSKGVCEVISAYRSPRTNEYLRAKTNGVAKKSLHLKGRAIDVRFSDVPTRELRDAAISLQAGGVGYYAKSDFVHLDTGRIRSW
jgi:uncharacterized protein YcbK (DUF882 family)